jgi:hypothetical protein
MSTRKSEVTQSAALLEDLGGCGAVGGWVGSKGSFAIC